MLEDGPESPFIRADVDSANSTQVNRASLGIKRACKALRVSLVLPLGMGIWHCASQVETLGKVTDTVFVAVQLASVVFAVEVGVLLLEYADEHLSNCLGELSSQSTTPLGLMQFPHDLNPDSGMYDWAAWMLLNALNMGAPVHKQTSEPAANVAKQNFAFIYKSFLGATLSSGIVGATWGCLLLLLESSAFFRGTLQGPASTDEFRQSFRPFLGVMAVYMSFGFSVLLRYTSLLKFLTTVTEVSLFDRSSSMMKAIRFYASLLPTCVAIVWTLEVICAEFGGVWQLRDAAGKAVIFGSIAVTICASIHVLYSLTASTWRKLRELQDGQVAHWSQQIEAQYEQIFSGSSSCSDHHQHFELFDHAQVMKGHVESVWSFPLGSAAIKPLAFSISASMVPFAISLIQGSNGF
jgi:hypothetical protein